MRFLPKGPRDNETGVQRVRLGRLRGYRAANGKVFTYTDRATKRAAYTKAIEMTDDLRLVAKGYDSAVPEFEDGHGRCYVGPNRNRYYFKSEGERRCARLQAWSGLSLPKHMHASMSDHLELVDAISGHRAHIYTERPLSFEAGIRELLRARRRAIKSKSKEA